jgi:hypothetical protein
MSDAFFNHPISNLIFDYRPYLYSFLNSKTNWNIYRGAV